jgi:hypothetical protein
MGGCEGLNLDLKPGQDCPICHNPIAWLECRRVKSKVGGVEREHIYIYAWHTFKEDGKTKRKKCYVGAYTYDYVARKYVDVGIVLRGMALGISRIAQHINEATDTLVPAIESGTLDVNQARKLLASLKDSLAKLGALVDKLDGYVRLHGEEPGDQL